MVNAPDAVSLEHRSPPFLVNFDSDIVGAIVSTGSDRVSRHYTYLAHPHLLPSPHQRQVLLVPSANMD